jgi:hypothetical protein
MDESAFPGLLSCCSCPTRRKAMSLMNEELRRLEDSPSDALLVSILVLAAHGPIISGAYLDELIHSLSPLAKTQNLDFLWQS